MIAARWRGIQAHGRGTLTREGLRGREETRALQAKALLRHDLNHVEGRPAHFMAEHLELRR